MNIKELKIKGKSYKLPVFLPDATLGIVRSLDKEALEKIGVRGVVVNTYYLNDTPGMDILKEYSVAKVQPSQERQRMRRLDLCKSDDCGSGIKNFMNFNGLVVSDSGGWQVFSLIKRHGEGGRITDEGVEFKIGGENNRKNKVFTPEDSIRMQFDIGADILICLDDFTGADDSEEKIKESVERTILWAKRTRKEFDKIVKEKRLTDETRPLLFSVIQGGWSKKLRKYCAEELLKIGFDGYGYGGYMVNDEGELDVEMSKYIAELIPDEFPKFALGVGKPWDIARCYEFGWDIFDCVLPTRDGRHKRLYNIKDKSTEDTDLKDKDSYEFIYINRAKFAGDKNPIGVDCDCFTCQNYSKGYLHHLFRIEDMLVYRLATIHNLRVYMRVIENLTN